MSTFLETQLGRTTRVSCSYLLSSALL